MIAGTTSREFHPGIFNAALSFAWDAFNARTVAIGEYHYTDLCVIAYKLPLLYYGAVVIAPLSLVEKISWHTHRLARHKSKVSVLPCTATALSSVLSLSKNKVNEKL